MMSSTHAVLQLLLTRGLGPKTLGRLLDAVAEERREVEELVQLPASELVSRFGLKSEVAGNITSGAEAAEVIGRRLEAKGITVLVKHQESYPARLVKVLGDSTPPILFAAGNLSLLARQAVSFCGSRKSSEFGLIVTKKLAARLANLGINVVSGYAAGVDSAAHGSAIEAGGVTAFVLAEGILHFRPKCDIADQITEENSLVLSEFLPDTKWAAHYAMERNRTVCALSKAVILIESGLDGGTFNAGETALALGLPLFVIDFDMPPESAEGNRHFLASGAMGLRPDPSGNVDIEPVLDAVKETVTSRAGNGWLFPDVMPTKKGRKARRSAS
jgi:DNA protecting protein DprA